MNRIAFLVLTVMTLPALPLASQPTLDGLAECAATVPSLGSAELSMRQQALSEHCTSLLPPECAAQPVDVASCPAAICELNTDLPGCDGVLGDDSWGSIVFFASYLADSLGLSRPEAALIGIEAIAALPPEHRQVAFSELVEEARASLPQVQRDLLVSAMALSLLTEHTITVESGSIRLNESSPGLELAVLVNSQSIQVDGTLVLELVQGLARPTDHISSTSPVLRVLKEHVEGLLAARPGVDATAQLEIVSVPYQTLTDVMITLSTAGITDFTFVGQQNTELVSPPAVAYDGPSPPRVLIAVTDGGFTVTDLVSGPEFGASGLARPDSSCSIEPLPNPLPTLCAAPDIDGRSLSERLPWFQLYNLLVAIHGYPEWHGGWDETNAIVNIVADQQIEVSVVLKLMDIARSYRELDRYDSADAFEAAPVRLDGDLAVPLFSNPVMLLPRTSD